MDLAANVQPVSDSFNQWEVEFSGSAADEKCPYSETKRLAKYPTLLLG